MKEQLVLWGKHPAHCDGRYLPVCDYTKKAYDQRKKEGWTDLIGMRKNEHPEDYTKCLG